MTLETKSIVLNALPLFLAAALLLGAALRQRARGRVESAGLAAGTVVAAALGVLVAVDGRPLAGHLWGSFVLLLASIAAAGLAVAVPPRRESQEPDRSAATAAADARLAAVRAISTELGRAVDAEAIARTLLGHARELAAVDFAALALIDEDGAEASGLLAQTADGDVPWFAEVRVDLLHEPSGIASAAFEAAPITVYDVGESMIVNRELAARAGVKSIAFVPLVASSRVAAVLVVATTKERRAFGGEDLALLEMLAGEAALALDRTLSASALAEALERERLVSAIARKVRTELDHDDILQVAVQETGRALSLSRCFIRLEDAKGGLAAEWHADGLAPVGEAAPRLPTANLAARERRTVVVDDVTTAAEIAEPSLGGRDTLVGLGSGAVVATPMVVVDELVGVLALHRPQPLAWSAGDISVAEAVAREVGLALHAAGLLRENRERLEHQSALLEAARVVTGELHLETVLQRLVTEVAHLLDVDAADCYLIDPVRGVFRCAAVHGLPESMRGFEFPLQSGLAAQALRESRPVLSNDYTALSEPVPGDVYADFVGVIAAPMRWSDEIRGVLGVGTRHPDRRFTERDAELLEAFAGLASLALQNAQSYERGARQARIERGFYRIASILGTSLSLAETLDAVAQAACTALGGSSAAVLTPGVVSLELSGRHELPERLHAPFGDDLVRPSSALVAAVRERQVLASPELASDDRFAGALRDLALEEGYRSLLAIPVDTPRTEQRGLVVVFFDEQREFSDDDLELAERLAQVARGALERSELFETERNARALSQQLARSGSMVSTELDPAAVLDEVVRRAPALLSADAAVVWVAEAGSFVATTASGDAEGAVGAEAPANRGLVAAVAQGRAPMAIAHAPAEVASDEAMLSSGFTAFLGVPLALPEAEGVLAVYSQAPRAWRTEETESLAALGGSAAAALSNAELYQRVAQEKERSFAILANIADGIVAVDREGRVVLWNAAAERITGVAAAEALGREPSQVLQRTLSSGDDSPAGDRLIPVRRGSEEVWLSLTEAVMRDPAGAVSGRIFAFRDISSERAVEQIKSDFVSAVSHELRTPLTSIYGFAETLLRGDVAFGPEERKIFLGYIASESERLASIVDTLLNVARLDTGDLVIQLGPVDVRPVVSDVVADVRAGSALNGHRIEVDLPAESLDAQADAEKLRQVLGQLVDNALRYSPGGGTVRIEGRHRDDVVELAVSDEGIGVPHAEQERIFRKFYRGEAATRGGRLGGTGLGLFIARELVNGMGGRIWVDSREGEGARFALELPVALQSARI